MPQNQLQHGLGAKRRVPLRAAVLSSQRRLTFHRSRQEPSAKVLRSQTPDLPQNSSSCDTKRSPSLEDWHSFDIHEREAVYRRAPRPEDDAAGLCQPCATINFEAIYKINPISINYYVDLPAPVIDLEQLSDSTPSKCPLCQIFRDVVDNFPPVPFFRIDTTRKWQLVVFPGSRYLGAPSDGLLLCLADGHWSAPLEGGLVLTCNWQSSIPINPLVTCRPNFLSCKGVNWEFITSEIQKCSTQYCVGKRGHLQETSWKDLIVADMKLIDCACSRRSVVTATTNMAYLTLSYVWGEEQLRLVSGTSEITAVPDHAPQTIVDAIEATLKLGHRYLWIDRYCINQANEKQKQLQIEKMAVIFRCSTATLVALGPDAGAGLWGVSADRNDPKIARTAECGVVYMGPGIRRTLGTSVWNSRAWTLQETLLSPRLVIFGPSQVFVTCCSGTVSEAVEGISHPLQSIEMIDRAANVSDFSIHGWANTQSIYDKQRRDGSENFEIVLRDYTSRQLSYESDALNAFRGYLSICGISSYWGVPIFKVVNSGSKVRLINPGQETSRFHDGPEWDWLTSLTIAKREEQRLRSSTFDRAFQHLGLASGLCWIHERSRSDRASTASTDNQCLPCPFPSWSWASSYHPTQYTTVDEFSFLSNEQLKLEDVLFTPTVSVESESGASITMENLLGGMSGATGILPEQGPIIHLNSRLTTFCIEKIKASPSYFPSPFVVANMDWKVLTSLDIHDGEEQGEQKRSHRPYAVFTPDLRKYTQQNKDSTIPTTLRDRPVGDVTPPLRGHAILLLWKQEAIGHSDSRTGGLRAYWMAVRFDDGEQCWKRIGLISVVIDLNTLSSIKQKALASAVKQELDNIIQGDGLEYLRIG